jgi:hypothetical protein
MRAALDPRVGGAVHAKLMADPQFALEVAISKLREEAIARGEVPPCFYRIEPYDGPVLVKNPGRKRRKRAAKQEAAK